MDFVPLTEASDVTTPAVLAMAGLLAVSAAFELNILGRASSSWLGPRAGSQRLAAHTAEFRRLYRDGVRQS